MVYLITSNTTNLGESLNTTGINDPARYNNMLSQTFDIAPNSEIAVESIKITRNGNIQLSSANNQFAVFIGRDLNACGLDLDLSYSFPNRTWIRGGNETLNPQDLTSRIKYGLYAGLGQHPNFMPIADDGVKVELKNGSGESRDKVVGSLLILLILMLLYQHLVVMVLKLLKVVMKKNKVNVLL